MKPSKEVSEETNLESVFVQCVIQLNQIMGGKHDDLDENAKHSKVQQILRNYFVEENLDDVYEGFLRLLIEVANLRDLSQRNIAVHVVELFHEFFIQADPFDRDFIYYSMPEDKNVYLSALRLVAEFKEKYLEMVASVFRLTTDESKQKVVIPLIKEMLKDNEVTKAVEWIVFFNLRDQFQSFFQQVICHLLLANQPVLLEKYVGEDIYRRRKFISYLNKLIGMNMKFFRGYTELEELVLQEGKKLIDTAVKYLKLYDFPDSEAPNVLEMRARRSLIAHHFKWINGEISLENYETTAMQSMGKSAYVHRYYLDFLCVKGLHRKALMFAFSLGGDLETFPKKLKEYCAVNPQAVEIVAEEVKKKREAKRKQQEEDEQKQCRLDDDTPIVWVNTWERLMGAMDELDAHKVIGIDTEGMPHFHSVKEEVALIQVACSAIVFLIDVIALKKILNVKQWLYFFEIVLFSDEIVKIDKVANLRNTQLSTVPTIDPKLIQYLRLSSPPSSSIANRGIVLSLRAKRAIPAHAIAPKVFAKVETLLSESAKNFTINLNLNEVAKLFLGVELDKSERVGNWAQRPLRPEQKKYAALDAFSLIGCFRVITERLQKLDDAEIFDTLKDAAMMPRMSEKDKPNCNAFSSSLPLLNKNCSANDEDEKSKHLSKLNLDTKRTSRTVELGSNPLGIVVRKEDSYVVIWSLHDGLMYAPEAGLTLGTWVRYECISGESIENEKIKRLAYSAEDTIPLRITARLELTVQVAASIWLERGRDESAEFIVVQDEVLGEILCSKDGYVVERLKQGEELETFVIYAEDYRHVSHWIVVLVNRGVDDWRKMESLPSHLDELADVALKQYKGTDDADDYISQRIPREFQQSENRRASMHLCGKNEAVQSFEDKKQDAEQFSPPHNWKGVIHLTGRKISEVPALVVEHEEGGLISVLYTAFGLARLQGSQPIGTWLMITMLEDQEEDEGEPLATVAENFKLSYYVQRHVKIPPPMSTRVIKTEGGEKILLCSIVTCGQRCLENPFLGVVDDSKRRVMPDDRVPPSSKGYLVEIGLMRRTKPKNPLFWRVLKSHGEAVRNINNVPLKDSWVPNRDRDLLDQPFCLGM